MRKVLRVAEEEPLLVILLAGFAVVFLSIFPPQLLVNDSFLTLVAGREIVENGLPHGDELTVLGAGREWTDQQWAAQVLAYAAHTLGGHPLLAVVAGLLVVGAFAIADRGRPLARRRPAGDRAHLLPRAPRSPLGVDDPRAGLRAAPLHGSRLAPRLGGATAVPQGLPRDSDPRRVGEPARQRGSRRIPHGAPRGDRPRRRRADGARRGTWR